MSAGKSSTLVCQAGKFIISADSSPWPVTSPACWGTAGLEELGIKLAAGAELWDGQHWAKPEKITFAYNLVLGRSINSGNLILH